MKKFDQQTTQRNPNSHQLNTMMTTRPLGLPPARRRGRLLPMLIVGSALLISSLIVAFSSGMLALPPLPVFTGSHASASSPGTGAAKIVGHVFFLSSGQINQQTSQGITDQVQIDLSLISAAEPGKAYYAWLQSDNPIESQSVLLGRLSVRQGTVHLIYSGDQQHTNLLAFTNRFLITEEDAALTPTVPSLDTRTWQYVALFPHTPNPLDTQHHYSLLDHMRHLLALDPTLKRLGLTGGLDIWLFRNAQKILEWSGAARDDWARQDTGLIHRQFIRMLDYLDGSSFVQNDLPAGSPFLVDPMIGRVGLLQFDANQAVPGYLQHIGIHLQGIIQSPGSTSEQHQLAQQIETAINKVQVLFNQIRTNTIQLVHMSPAQLVQPAALALMDSTVKAAQDAFMGQFDPQTGDIQGGITQIHFAIQRLATMDVSVVS